MADQRVMALAVVALLIGALFVLIRPQGAPGAAEVASSCTTDPQNLAYSEDSTGGLSCYNNIPQNVGLIVHLPFDDGSGTVIHDLSGLANNGATVNGPAWQGPSQCVAGNCLKFASSSSTYVRVRSGVQAPLGFTGVTSLSVFLWVYPTAFTQTARVVDKWTQDGIHNDFMLTIDTSGNIRCYDSTAVSTTGPVALKLGAWAFIGCVYDLSQTFGLSAYVDSTSGVRVTSHAITNTVNYLEVGGAPDDVGSSFFNGNIDDLQIWARALSPNEVQAVYQSPISASVPTGPQSDRIGLLGWWPMDEGSGTSAYDLTPNLDTMTLTNAPTWQSGANCKFGGCLQFASASSQYLVDGSIPTSQTADSVSLWVKFTTVVAMNPMVFINGDANGNRQMSVYVTGAGTLYFVVANAALYGYFGWSPSAATWYNVVAVFDAGTLSVYVNGASQTLSVVGSSATIGRSYGTTYLGYDSANGVYLNGVEDDVRVYNRALSATEASILYAYGVGALPNPVHP